jgi:hypothetical protein
MIFQSIKTSKLDKLQINQILKLKNSYWNYGYKSQLQWFKKNAYQNDLHNLILVNNEIIGYTFLANRNYETFKSNKIKKKELYILFSSLILSKKFRNFFYASKLMISNNRIILKKKKISFLYCDRNKVNFYRFFGWIDLKKSLFNVIDHKSNQVGMIYNFKKNNLAKTKYFNFYYHS